MLTLFRKIRKSLVENSNQKKYLLYALGEIFLVMIGILLALQVNNWSTEKKNRDEERSLLIEMRIALQEDLVTFREKFDKVIKVDTKLVQLQKLFESKEKLDSINILFGGAYGTHIFKLNTAAYEVLKSNGFKLIVDDSIRKLIVQIYDTHLKFIEGVNDLEVSVVIGALRPYYLENFKDIRFLNNATPKDEDKVLSDDYYHNLIDYRLTALNFNIISEYPTIMADMNELIEQIERYLEGK